MGTLLEDKRLKDADKFYRGERGRRLPHGLDHCKGGKEEQC